MVQLVRIWLIFFTALIFLLNTSFSFAKSLQISVKPPGLYEIANGGNQWTVYLDGVIEPGDDKRVEKELAKIPNPPVSVYLNSPGGDFLTGIKLGQLLRSQYAWTDIGKQISGKSQNAAGECYSACAIAYLGGYYRFFTEGSKYGVHRTWKDSSPGKSDFDIGQIISAALSAYISEMGINNHLLDLIVSAGKNELYILNDAELDSLRITNHGRKTPDWSLQLSEGTYYLQGVQDTMYGTGKFILYCTNESLVFNSIYSAGPDIAPLIARGDYYHSLMVDDRTIPLSKPLHIKDDNLYVYAMFVLTHEQITQIANARKSLGHAMQLSREAITFRGYNVDLDSDTPKKLQEFISTCPSK